LILNDWIKNYFLFYLFIIWISFSITFIVISKSSHSNLSSMQFLFILLPSLINSISLLKLYIYKTLILSFSLPSIIFILLMSSYCWKCFSSFSLVILKAKLPKIIEATSFNLVNKPTFLSWRLELLLSFIVFMIHFLGFFKLLREVFRMYYADLSLHMAARLSIQHWLQSFIIFKCVT